MTSLAESNEFSIILLTDQPTTEKVLLMRAQLLASPIREDPPHMTLLRGVSSVDHKSDEELLNDVGKQAEKVLQEVPSVTASGLQTLDSDLFGPTSVIKLVVPQQLSEVRLELIEQVQEMGYRVEAGEVTAYNPHMTITLGVPLPDSKQIFLAAIHTDDEVPFSGFALLRVYFANGKRLARLVKPH